METKDKLYYYHNDINGAPLRLTDEAGNVVWNVHYNIFGKIDKLKINEVHNPIRMQGQYEDEETGLYYNRYRYYDPNISAYVSQDPLGLLGGTNLYSYPINSFKWADPLGLIATNTTGYSVYELYAPGAEKPYYVGITNDVKTRMSQHQETGRFIKGQTTYKVPYENITYGEARGIEQARIEHHGTKTAAVGSDISKATTYEERGNKVNSFDTDSKTRAPERQAVFNSERQKELGKLEGKKKIGCS